MQISIRLIKNIKSKTAFILRLTPKIEKTNNYRKYIPEPNKALLLISADFELAWAWQYAKCFPNPKEGAEQLARQARKNIPVILDLCDKYNIPITWATVGHLFLEECKKKDGKAHLNIKRLPYFENKYWKYDSGDWFDYDLCTNWKDAPEWYALDLIKEILSRKVKHEIGCHTFSHINCRDEVCSSEVFESEINECQKVAKEYGIKLKSFVHPGHIIGNLNTLAKSGFTSFRTDYHNTLGYPIKHKSGLWELKSTMEFVWREGWSPKYHIYRYNTIIKRAIKYNKVCHFWFHPSQDGKFIKNVLPYIFKFLDEHRKDILIITSQKYIKYLNG